MNVVPRAMFAGVLLMAGVVSAAAPAEPLPPFPNLELRSLADGSVSQLDAHHGHPLLVTFWASWCGPCRMEMPEIQKLYGELKGSGFEVVTVNLDTVPELARRFLDKLDLSLPVYRANPMEVRQIGVSHLPTNVLLDAAGYPVQIYEGYNPAMVKDIRQRVEKLLEEPPATPTKPDSPVDDARAPTHV